ncbi:CLUMA_CG017364, isoform A [Clunio marinus]|uniref:Odorant receptor n=1 Tax=Clunio marinus TaxID=568069 RepID=A0A1J1J0A2_9DIPT|nr:CLUMA_CG017364, isoform A [Clunio marinus]
MSMWDFTIYHLKIIACQRRYIFKDKIWVIFNVFSYAFFGIPIFLFIIQSFKVITDVAEMLLPFVIEFNVFIKICTFYSNRETFYLLMEEMEEVRANRVNNFVVKYEMSRMEYYLNIFKVLYSRILIFAGTSFWLAPIIHTCIMKKFLGHDDFQRYMPIKAIYPFDMYATPYYEFLYFYISYPIFLSIYGSGGVDIMFFEFCRALCDEFDIIQRAADTETEDKKILIGHHSKVLKVADQLVALMEPIIFVQFLIGSLTLCVVGFQLVMSDDFVQKFVVTFLGLSVTGQLFFYSLFAQLLADYSTTAADFSFALDTDYVLFIMRAQKSVVVKGGFYLATLETFNDIVSSAGSLIALMQSFVA